MLFIRPSKHFSFLRYLKFFLDFFVRVGKWLDKKANLISNFMTSSTGKQKISIHISRNKDNQTTKFG